MKIFWKLVTTMNFYSLTNYNLILLYKIMNFEMESKKIDNKNYNESHVFKLLIKKNLINKKTLFFIL